MEGLGDVEGTTAITKCIWGGQDVLVETHQVGATPG